jgi:hypothetical protein
MAAKENREDSPIEHKGSSLDEVLMAAVDRLSSLALDNFMPGDADPFLVDESASSELRSSANAYTRRTLESFISSETDGVEFSLEHKRLHDGFIELVERFLERELASFGLGLEQFADGLREALGGANSQRFSRAGAREVICLIDEISMFEPWAKGMRSLSFLRTEYAHK